MRGRRGVAMLAALWLVVAIAVVALQFARDAHERRALGLNAAERGQARGAALGALALTQARLEQALRTMPQGNAALSGTRSGDPWMDVDSVYSGTLTVDSTDVELTATDLGTRLNINLASDTTFRTFFGFVLGDYAKAAQLADMILDWRDLDDLARPSGDERDGYVKKGLLHLPANGPFEDVADLLQVEGMTPEIYAQVAPYLTVYGSGTVNLNTAPVPVLRALPGMTDQILANILNQRARGLRIASVAQVIPGASGGGGGRGGAGMLATLQLRQLTQAATVDTREVELQLTGQVGPQARPTRLTALLQRNGQTVTLAWVLW